MDTASKSIGEAATISSTCCSTCLLAVLTWRAKDELRAKIHLTYLVQVSSRRVSAGEEQSRQPVRKMSTEYN